MVGAGLLVLDGVAVATDLNETIEQARRLSSFSWTGLAVLQLVALLLGFIPASVLAVAAGAMLGVAEGFALSTLTLTVGATVSFWSSRPFGRPFIERFLCQRARISALDEALGQQGWRLVCLMRVSPVMPFAATSYAFGLSRVSLPHYMMGTLASLPALFGYVLVGALVARGVRSDSAQSWMGSALLALGVAATAVLTARIGAVIGYALKATTVKKNDVLLP